MLFGRVFSARCRAAGRRSLEVLFALFRVESRLISTLKGVLIGVMIHIKSPDPPSRVRPLEFRCCRHLCRVAGSMLWRDVNRLYRYHNGFKGLTCLKLEFARPYEPH